MTSQPEEYLFKRLGRVGSEEYRAWLCEALGGVSSSEFQPPASYKILAHCWQESGNALDAGDARLDWAVVANVLAEASEKLDTRDLEAVCEVFFQLGQCCGKLSMPSEERYHEGLKAIVEKQAREWPLRKQNICSSTCKDMARALAQELWRRDLKKKMRLTEMAHDVWAWMWRLDIPKEIRERLPDRAEGIKPWIREVAPDYARKGGAPTKKK